jgi:hypothetical protein
MEGHKMIRELITKVVELSTKPHLTTYDVHTEADGYHVDLVSSRTDFHYRFVLPTEEVDEVPEEARIGKSLMMALLPVSIRERIAEYAWKIKNTEDKI